MLATRVRAHGDPYGCDNWRAFYMGEHALSVATPERDDRSRLVDRFSASVVDGCARLVDRATDGRRLCVRIPLVHDDRNFRLLADNMGGVVDVRGRVDLATPAPTCVSKLEMHDDGTIELRVDCRADPASWLRVLFELDDASDTDDDDASDADAVVAAADERRRRTAVHRA